MKFKILSALIFCGVFQATAAYASDACTGLGIEYYNKSSVPINFLYQATNGNTAAGQNLSAGAPEQIHNVITSASTFSTVVTDASDSTVSCTYTGALQASGNSCTVQAQQCTCTKLGSDGGKFYVSLNSISHGLFDIYVNHSEGADPVQGNCTIATS